MAAKTVQAPGLMEDAIGADVSWLFSGRTIELILVAMVLTTVCYQLFSAQKR